MRDDRPGPLAALDPGRGKCGLVLTDPAAAEIRQALVLPPEAAWERLERWCGSPAAPRLIVLGGGTGSDRWRRRLEPLLPVAVVDERGTTLAARRRYWELFPPGGWRRLLPEGLRQPPRDWDDVVAQLLLERWLGRELRRSGGRFLRGLPAP
ncbi:MAG: resolvase [Synechococcaceae cyanobacterium]|nr:resolvase [Synechococcaceae cyanobacterium]